MSSVRVNQEVLLKDEILLEEEGEWELQLQPELQPENQDALDEDDLNWSWPHGNNENIREKMNCSYSITLSHKIQKYTRDGVYFEWMSCRFMVWYRFSIPRCMLSSNFRISVFFWYFCSSKFKIIHGCWKSYCAIKIGEHLYVNATKWEEWLANNIRSCDEVCSSSRNTHTKALSWIRGIVSIITHHPVGTFWNSESISAQISWKLCISIVGIIEIRFFIEHNFTTRASKRKIHCARCYANGVTWKTNNTLDIVLSLNADMGLKYNNISAFWIPDTPIKRGCRGYMSIVPFVHEDEFSIMKTWFHRVSRYSKRCKYVGTNQYNEQYNNSNISGKSECFASSGIHR